MRAKDFIAYWLVCVNEFQEFKKGERYWLEALPNNQYNVRSDNLLGKTFTITDEQLFSNFMRSTNKLNNP